MKPVIQMASEYGRWTYRIVFRDRRGDIGIYQPDNPYWWDNKGLAMLDAKRFARRFSVEAAPKRRRIIPPLTRDRRTK